MQRRRERRNLIHIGCYFFELTYFLPQRIDWVRRLLVWQWCIEKCKRERLHKNHYTRASIVTRSYSLNFSAFVGLFHSLSAFHSKKLKREHMCGNKQIKKLKHTDTFGHWNVHLCKNFLVASLFKVQKCWSDLFWCIFVTHAYPPKNPVGYLWSTKDI